MNANWRQPMPTPEAYWMDRVLFDIHHNPDDLARYKRDPDAYLDAFPLAAAARAAIRDNDIGAMYLRGVNPYLLRAHCLGLHIAEEVFLDSLRAVATTEPSHG